MFLKQFITHFHQSQHSNTCEIEDAELAANYCKITVSCNLEPAKQPEL